MVMRDGVMKDGAITGGGFLLSPLPRAQYAALAEMRWRMLLNSLRTRRGNFELAARIVGIGFFSLLGLAMGAGLGLGAWRFASDGTLQFLPFLIWPVLFLWQLTPVMVASFQEHVDLSVLLRFPVSFGSYLLQYLVYGLFDISSILGGICLAGIWTGLVCARPNLVVWVTVVLMAFAAFNLLLTRMIFSWLDRWLAQRRTREILGIVFLFLILGVQLLNPAFYQHSGQQPGHRSRMTRSATVRTLRTADRIQSFLPPGLAARAIHKAARGHEIQALASLGGLALYACAAGSLLGLRLRAEYRGESLGEAPQRVTKPEETRGNAFDFAGPIGAVVEKELRYLARSGVMLYSLVAPLIVLFVLGRGSGAGFAANYGLPVGVAYGFLGLTRLVYNSLGGEGAGIQLYFLSPTPMRTVMLAKNLVHLGLFALELVVVCSIMVFRFGIPGTEILAATVCWLLFALPVQLAAGNVLSITMAYRMTLTRMSRDQGAAGNGLLSLLIQLLVFGVGVAVYLPLAHMEHARLAAPVFLVLAGGGAIAWLRVLSNADRMAERRKEALIQSLARTG